ncbi:MAG: GNAT family N-acetyltransferase [Clostridia bacterium]|nr:GNAT family N-acetyltransferase [Clostridia bacterium]
MHIMEELTIIEGGLSDVIRFYDSIIEEFPKGERKALDVFIRLFETGDYKLLIAFSETGIEVGYAFLYTIRKLSILWLDFIVIHPEFQGKGYGSKFFDKMSSFYDSYIGMLLEVEIPEEANENQMRRISFYERMGAVRLNLKYYLPNEFGGLEMYLYYKSFNSNASPEAEVVIAAIESAYEFIHSDIRDKELWLRQTINSQDGNQ